MPGTTTEGVDRLSPKEGRRHALRFPRNVTTSSTCEAENWTRHPVFRAVIGDIFVFILAADCAHKELKVGLHCFS